MKKLFVLVTLIVCGVAIIFGNLHWNKKISAQGEKETSTNERVIDQGETKEDVEISNYSRNLPKQLQEKITKAVSTGEPLELVIYGTTAAEEAWPDQFSKELNSTYGEDIFQVTIRSTGDKTTREIVNDQSYAEINEIKPDILLFEPPLLKDNGNVGIVNTLNNVQTIIQSWEKVNKEMILFIQPTNPLYSANYYPSEVAQLKDYAEKNDITYLDHWENWPDLEDIKMKEYLTEKNQANDAGHKVWAEYLLRYFIAK